MSNLNVTRFFRSEKKIKKNKNNFRHHLKNFILTSKVIRGRQQKSIDSKGILRQSESVEATKRLEVMGPISIQVSSAVQLPMGES